MFGLKAALVLRTQAVEAAEVLGGLRGAQSARTARVAAPAAEDGAMSQAIRAALERAQVKAKRLPVAIPSEEVLLRFFTLPLLPKAEWRTAVQFEVRKYIPFKIEELVWTFHVAEQKSARQLRVAFVGIRADRLQRLQGWLTAAGIAPTCLEPYSVSLARLAPPAPRASEQEFTALIEVEAEAAHVVIAQGQMPYFARDISLKETAPAAAGGSAQATDARSERLLSELSVSLDFFKRVQPSATVTRVLLYGEEAAVSPWCAAWASRLGCPVSLGRLPAAAAHPSVGLEWAGALSVALRSARQGSLDLLAASASKPSAKSAAAALKFSFSEAELISLAKSMARPARWQAAVAAIALIVCGIISRGRVGTARQAMARQAMARQAMARQLSALPDVGWNLQGRPLTELESLRAQAEQRLTALRAMIQQRIPVTKKLEGLTTVLPDGIWLESFTYTDRVMPGGGQSPASLILRGACYLSGSGSELEAIGGFAQRVKQHPGFSQGFATTQLGEVSQTKDQFQSQTYWKFQLTSEAERRPF